MLAQTGHRGHKMSLDGVDAKVEVARMTAGASLLTFWGITLENWVALLTIVYFACNIIILLPKVILVVQRVWERLRKDTNAEPESEGD